MDDPRKTMGFLISDIAKLLRRNFNRRTRGLGLSQAQWQTIAHLSRQEGINQATLADRLDIQPITLARLLDRLEEMELVRREADPNDRRAFRLFLTKKAQPLIDRMMEFGTQLSDDALAPLTDEHREKMLSALELVKQHLIDVERAAAEADSEIPTQKKANVAAKI